MGCSSNGSEDLQFALLDISIEVLATLAVDHFRQHRPTSTMRVPAGPGKIKLEFPLPLLQYLAKLPSSYRISPASRWPSGQ